MAPGILGKRWEARHNTVLAHVKAYKRYDKYRDAQKGKVGITLHSIWAEPETEADAGAAELVMQFEIGFWAEVIYGSGDYPAELKRGVRQSGRMLKEFSADEIRGNRGSSDFFGLNHYTTRIVKLCKSDDCGHYGEYGFEVKFL